VPIKEVYHGLFDGPHATPPVADDGPVFLGIGNVTDDGHLDLSSIRHISEADYPRWTKRVTPQADDIVFTYEATLNRYAMIPEGFRGCLGRRMALIRPDREKVEPRFLFYYFFGHEWRETIAANILSGATVNRIPLTSFPDFPISLPPLPTQQRIAAILSAYDDLIENNTRRIAILEEMARRLYEEWFVHFRFPGYEEVEFIQVDGQTQPLGWKQKEVKDLVKRLKNGTVYKQKDVAASGSTMVIDQSRAEYLGFHDNAADHEASATSPIIIFGDHTCKMQIMINPFSLGPNTIAFTSAAGEALFYLYALVQGSVETKEYKRHWTELMKKRVLVANVDLSERYDEAVRPMFSLIEVLRNEIRNLRAQRDLLLPKLVSGEIDVSEAEETIEAAE
jgi:type I restriction enzyme S subunit